MNVSMKSIVVCLFAVSMFLNPIVSQTNVEKDNPVLCIYDKDGKLLANSPSFCWVNSRAHENGPI